CFMALETFKDHSRPASVQTSWARTSNHRPESREHASAITAFPTSRPECGMITVRFGLPGPNMLADGGSDSWGPSVLPQMERSREVCTLRGTFRRRSSAD